MKTLKKYELTGATHSWRGGTLYQIRAVRDIDRYGVLQGDLGGWVAKELNLSQDGDAWVFGNACVWGNARISGNADVRGDVRISGNACVWGNARISGNADVRGNARISGNADVWGNARISGNALIQSTKHVFIASSVGSENGTLTAYTTKTGEIEITRGCFRGSLNKFEAAVKKRHDENRHAEEYLALIHYIRLRFRDVTVRSEEG